MQEKADYIRKVVDEGKTFSTVESESGISRKVIRDWVNKSPKILQAEGTSKKNLSGFSRSGMYPLLEKELVQFVREKRQKN